MFYINIDMTIKHEKSNTEKYNCITDQLGVIDSEY